MQTAMLKESFWRSNKEKNLDELQFGKQHTDERRIKRERQKTRRVRRQESTSGEWTIFLTPSMHLAAICGAELDSKERSLR